MKRQDHSPPPRPNKPSAWARREAERLCAGQGCAGRDHCSNAPASAHPWGECLRCRAKTDIAVALDRAAERMRAKCERAVLLEWPDYDLGTHESRLIELCVEAILATPRRGGAK